MMGLRRLRVEAVPETPPNEVAARYAALRDGLAEAVRTSSFTAVRGLAPEDADLLSACLTHFAAGQAAALRVAAVAGGGTSDASTNTCWMVHDVREMASMSATISAAIEELAASVAEISANSDASASNAEQARDGMSTTMSEMHLGRRAMTAIADRVTRIHECAQVLEGAVTQIGTMTSSIEAISRQTNLLALNATIEAARAGEAGKGFSVVAAEVKALSGQTALATQQIRDGIAMLLDKVTVIRGAVDESTQAVAEGDATAQRALVGLEAVGAGIADNAQRIRALATVIDQQRTAIDEVSSNVVGIADKAAKTREEIDKINALLVGNEVEVRGGFDAQRVHVGPTIALLRLTADAAAWKRRLAASLVGLEPLQAHMEVFDSRALRRSLEELRQGRGGNAEELVHLLGAEERAFVHACQLIDAVCKGDYGAATNAYVACDGVLSEMVLQADVVLARLARGTSDHGAEAA